MDKHYSFNSKINVRPSKSVYLFTIVLNICLIVTMIIGIFKIIMGGLKWDTLASMALAFVIVTAYKKRPNSKEHYEPAIASVSLLDHLLILAYSVNGKPYKTYQCYYADFRGLEYSDQLQCLHLVGSIEEKMADSNKGETVENLYLYISPEQAQAFVEEVSRASGMPVKYMDR